MAITHIRVALPLAIVTVCALAVRLTGLGTQELWLDEAFNYQLTRRGDWLALLLKENNPPLYPLLLRAWMAFFGAHEYALRSLSALFSVLFVVAIYQAGREAASARAGLWAAAFSAVAPLHIYYAQEARAYSLLMLLLCLAYTALMRASRYGKRREWVLFAVYASLALYTHYFAIFGLLATFAVVLTYRQAGTLDWRRYGMAMVAVVLSLSIWVALSMMYGIHVEGAHQWIEDVWRQTPPTLALAKSLVVLGIGSERDFVPIFLKQFSVIVLPQRIRWTGIASLAFLAAIFAAQWRDKALQISGPQKFALAALLLVPLLALYVLSLWRPFYVVGRYDVIAFPAYALMIGVGLAKLESIPRWGRLTSAVAVLPLAIVIATTLWLYYRSPSVHFGPSARATADMLQREASPDDFILFTGARHAAVLYYLERDGFSCRLGICAHQGTKRAFQYGVVPNDAGDVVFDLDRMDRTRYFADDIRIDIRRYASTARSLWLVIGTRMGERESRRGHDLVIEELNAAGLQRVGARSSRVLDIVFMRQSASSAR